jgi:hypothetical protein
MAVYLLLLALSRVVDKPVAAVVTGFIGTVVSGSVFLSSALLILGKLPAPFMFLFMTVVIPTALANTAVTPILYSLVTFSKRAAKLEF